MVVKKCDNVFLGDMVEFDDSITVAYVFILRSFWEWVGGAQKAVACEVLWKLRSIESGSDLLPLIGFIL